mmetsp:Transcript_1023/g.4184  ORF Transcript_1023/g.4184 Transcript_1023/m.4184 type:complete len:240 (+) Transcript_1023:509-1228(+)
MLAFVGVRVQDVPAAREVVLEGGPVRPNAARVLEGRDVHGEAAVVVHQRERPMRDVEQRPHVVLGARHGHLPEPAVGHTALREAFLARVLLVAPLHAALAARLPGRESLDLLGRQEAVGQVHVASSEARHSAPRCRRRQTSAAATASVRRRRQRCPLRRDRPAARAARRALWRRRAGRQHRAVAVGEQRAGGAPGHEVVRRPLEGVLKLTVAVRHRERNLVAIPGAIGQLVRGLPHSEQ